MQKIAIIFFVMSLISNVFSEDQGPASPFTSLEPERSIQTSAEVIRQNVIKTNIKVLKLGMGVKDVCKIFGQFSRPELTIEVLQRSKINTDKFIDEIYWNISTVHFNNNIYSTVLAGKIEVTEKEFDVKGKSYLDKAIFSFEISQKTEKITNH